MKRILWLATFKGKEDTMTAQIFMSKLNDLVDSIDRGENH